MFARFDNALLLAPAAPSSPPADEATAVWAPWAAWCRQGLGDGRRPWWRPWALPALPVPLALAVLEVAPGANAQAALQALQQALDGSHSLQQSGGGAAALLLRLRVKLADAAWWRARQQSDPWDCGRLRPEPESLRRLGVFRPRRATLVVACGLPPAALRQGLAVLKARQARLRQPVRLLLVVCSAPDGHADVPDWQAAPVFRLAAVAA